WAMTAHVVYEAFDPDLPATLSPLVIQNVIRAAIGFEGVLITDDMAMGAVGGVVADNCAKSLAAGCDFVLYCNSALTGDVLDTDLRTMEAIVQTLSPGLKPET